MTKVMCSVCGAGKAKLVKRSYRATYNGEAVEVPSIEMFRCEDCGEEFFNPEQARNLSVAVKNAVRKQLGLLPPEKIVAIREKLGLTQQELEELLGQGPKVVTRWENGRVIQHPSADMILRMLDREPATLETLRDAAKQRARAQRKHELVSA